ncbi:glycerol-3-phosphate 1-O-acyltransferase PlsY [Thiohalobacter sp. IOR34]|uniref:glycerol-3-phosphate 1-O-acyltransferase PlsY n=1 Tax=Thiohalobacter sp. IOR34 TaxID=3057176 RepID=UPI0025B18F91|nr:glycerol-3-phosphate 1-O-acyltransferase PlsY [Thiohalobacter sp. IOR34]WJW75373.1 glycerol-3-phosphate 1-O-acyltransferase PlsY [Thiohalobacter sp. IOR34]
MPVAPSAILLVLFAYLLGSVSTAVVVGRLLGMPDPRTQGSGNPGATNMLRLGGRKAGAITLLGDMAKGLIPMLLAHGLDAGAGLLAATGLAAFLGHLYPLYFGFRGGKGVATALGVLLGLHWAVGLATIGTWLGVALVSRISSLSALVAAAASPLYVWWLTGDPLLVAATGLMTLMLYWRHRSNIRNLLQGSEGRIKLGSKKD